MKRIFLSLAILANLLLGYAIWRGLHLGDSASLSAEVQQQIGRHMLIGLGALTFATLVHAIALTYFMGTGRFLEETSQAYSLSPEFHDRSRKLKYGMIPGMVICLLLLICTGALGALADKASPMNIDGTLGLTGARIHLAGAILTVLASLVTNLMEFRAISGNSAVIEDVLAAVKRIRTERGLPVE